MLKTASLKNTLAYYLQVLIMNKTIYGIEISLLLDLPKTITKKDTVAYYLKALIVNKNYLCIDISHVRHA
jgi:hypothetical protein